MRILCVISGMQNGGAERVMSTLVNYFSKNNKVRLVILKSEKSDYPISEDVEVIAGNIKHKNIIKSVLFVKKQIETYKPDIVLSFMTKNNIVSLIARSISSYKVPVVISERANPHNTKGLISFLRKITYPLANGCVFQTKWAKDYYKSILRCESEIIYNPLSPDFKVKPYLGSRSKKIVCTARLSPEKNQALLIKAFEKISKDYPDYKLEIYGEGPCRKKLQNLINKLKLNNKVYLMGRKKDIINHIKDAEIFVLPSNSEGMPNSLLEAEALGIPCIATDCPIGGSSIIIDNNINGLLISMNDVKELSISIKKILDNNDLSKKFSENGPKIIQKFDHNIICKQWEEYLKKMSR